MIDDFTNTWLKVIKNPATFFKQMPTKEGYAAPVTFVVICYLIIGTIGFLTQFLIIGADVGITMDLFTMGLIGIIKTTLTGVIGLFIGGLLLHIFFKIFGGKAHMKIQSG